MSKIQGRDLLSRKAFSKETGYKLDLKKYNRWNRLKISYSRSKARNSLREISQTTKKSKCNKTNSIHKEEMKKNKSREVSCSHSNNYLPCNLREELGIFLNYHCLKMHLHRVTVIRTLQWKIYLLGYHLVFLRNQEEDINNTWVLNNRCLLVLQLLSRITWIYVLQLFLRSQECSKRYSLWFCRNN